MTRYMQQEEKELIIKLHLEGKFTTEIAKECNLIINIIQYANTEVTN